MDAFLILLFIALVYKCYQYKQYADGYKTLLTHAKMAALTHVDAKKFADTYLLWIDMGRTRAIERLISLSYKKYKIPQGKNRGISSKLKNAVIKELKQDAKDVKYIDLADLKKILKKYD